MGRTNIVLDEGLVRQAMRLIGAKTKRQAVDLALRELVARRTVYQALRRLRRAGMRAQEALAEARRCAHGLRGPPILSVPGAAQTEGQAAVGG